MMRPPFDVARFLGTWRWLVAKNAIILSSGISLALGIEPSVGHAGVSAAWFAGHIHPNDQHVFFGAIEKATCFGGEIDLSYRLTLDGFVEPVKILGSCVRSRPDGSPAEYMGAIHVCEIEDEAPLAIAADHLLSAAEIARGQGEPALAYFIDMALMEAGIRIGATEFRPAASAPRIAVVKR